ncbi:ABC transporter ATP-binding protein [Frischella perrara]|uniref:ABC transporter ATP-binding protein n=1 Tax=Frischella perrara TaxID=1267021 RepID=UPI0023F3327D|nr:ABC transporter ATP-binding protein [Frischella perrara]MCT6875532.1 ABC transporter ATP-binding protein [Frischella perrara]
MALITLHDAYLSFSDAPLLDHANLSIERGERVCLVGRNGAGKSTLLKILNQEIPLDDGQIIVENDIVIARLQQDPPRNIGGTVYDFVAEGLQDIADLLKQYHHMSKLIENDPSDDNLTKLARLQEQLDIRNGWQMDNRINNVLSELDLSPDSELSSLSGGWLRKAALAKALVNKPDLLLLDEPTNHLDIDAIAWLEEFLKGFSGSIVFISHDRSFIRHMATRIVDLDRGNITSWPGDYEQYLQAKEEALRVEELQNAEFDKKLAQEEVWIRQGIKARRTRNEGRVRALKALRQEYAERRQVMGTAKLQIEEALRSGKIIFDIENVSYQIGNKKLVDHFTAQILRGDKIALIGPNGIGKSTLIKLMLQEITPTSGSIHSGTKLEVAYFDQHRADLDPDKSVMDNLAYGKQEVTVNGRSRHVLGYLQDFLFHPKRARTPVSALSGGEKNRLLLAKLFLKPSNLLILDEPTNDLDIETLELLEELINEYKGTVLLVSHDRQFVDNAVNQCWFFEGDGKIVDYPGGYYDAYQQQQNTRPVEKNIEKVVETAKPAAKPENVRTTTTAKRLSYKQTRELEALPQRIEQLEQELSQLQQQITEPSFFEQPHEITNKVLSDIADKEQALEQAFNLWEELEAIKNCSN